jgi:hypothetical protein
VGRITAGSANKTIWPWTDLIIDYATTGSMKKMTAIALLPHRSLFLMLPYDGLPRICFIREKTRKET